jgi:serine/threonine protein kinase
MLKHPNNLVMKDSFTTNEGDDEYLNIVMDYYSDNLYQVIKKREMNPILIKLYSYQIFRGLNYLFMLSIAHRDIKPQNILVDSLKHKVIISDFGSAKQLVKCTNILTEHRQILPIFAADATEPLNSSSGQRTTLLRSTCGLLDASWCK